MKKIMTLIFILISILSKAQTSEKLPYENIPDSVFQNVEVEAAFPGGPISWYRYVKRELENKNIDLKKYENEGACEIQFKVNREGVVSDVTALTLVDTKLAKALISIIKKGPRWLPAIQNGRQVSSWRKIEISYPIENSVFWHIKNVKQD
jgi:hypothetical protein